MSTPRKASGDDLGIDMLGTVGLVLNFAAVIALALWLSAAGGGSPGGSAVLAGVLTVGLFAASIVCFAAQRGDQ
ncbi:MAG: hypothetical protein FGM50_06645 [Mycobacterium sp.]|nr:hypothetical protein [Mycobacterium sp.]